MLKAICSKIDLSDSNSDYYSLVSDLLDHELVLQMTEYTHHGRTSCFQHCLNVSYYNYILCKFFSLDKRAAARAGLLHDLFLYDWHTYKPQKGERLHGFTHAEKALNNVMNNFYITDLEADIIKKHMFPLNLFAFPKYRETFIIILVDKYCGSIEVIDNTIFAILSRFKKMPFIRRKSIFQET